MSDHITDEEQVERLKKWWKENGNSVIAGIVIGIASVAGVHYWYGYQERKAAEASSLYDSYVEALAKNDQITTKLYNSKLRDEHKGTPYAALTALLQAKLNVVAGDLDAATADLQWAIINPGHASIANLARVRLARILVAQKKYVEVLNLLDKAGEAAFAASFAELRGDAYKHLGDKQKATLEYQKALVGTALTGKQREFVEMKLNDLGPAEIAATSSKK